MEFAPKDLEKAFVDCPTKIIFKRDFDPPDFKVSGLGEDGKIVKPKVGIVIETSKIKLTYHGGVFDEKSLQVEILDSTISAKKQDGFIAKQLKKRKKAIKCIATTNGINNDELSSRLTRNWAHGDERSEGYIADNLRGTCRTLDHKTGPVSLEPGLLNKQGYTVIHDEGSCLFQANGWITDPPEIPGRLDLYFFWYKRDYSLMLTQFAALSGAVPLIPRFCLGNWWSRWYEYTQESLLQLMDEFNYHQIPLAVCCIDMDWHLVDEAKQHQLQGWTGYTWNKKLFPDPHDLLNNLRKRGIRVNLNLHPADGFGQHEEHHSAVAAFLNIDSKQNVPFDCINREFMSAYFDIVHAAREEEGVAFWWIDWQQGDKSKLKTVDPLFWLNHLHFAYSQRELPDAPTSDSPVNESPVSGSKSKKTKKVKISKENELPMPEISKALGRGIILSRWGGLGCHRYPIGFSGDTNVQWCSLAFQPYMTATASNVLFGWWSHDIGGFGAKGEEEAELFIRWVQFGCFSPILRLHSMKSEAIERRPWGWSDPSVLLCCHDSMSLRHQLIPYIYSIACEYHFHADRPLIRPMYYSHPHLNVAYHVPHQYWFGSQLLCAPIISRSDPTLNVAVHSVWFPPTCESEDVGCAYWFDFFTGETYEADRMYRLLVPLSKVPVFAKPGAIVPLASLTNNTHDNKLGVSDFQQHLTVRIFPGASNHFELFEDDSSVRFSSTTGLPYHHPDKQEVTSSASAHWRRFRTHWVDNTKMQFHIDPSSSPHTSSLPSVQFILQFMGLASTLDVVSVKSSITGEEISGTNVKFQRYPFDCVFIDQISLAPSEGLVVEIEAFEGLLACRRTPSILAQHIERFPEHVHKILRNASGCNSDWKRAFVRLNNDLRDADIPEDFSKMLTSPSIASYESAIIGTSLEIATQVGVHVLRQSVFQKVIILVWNSNNDSNALMSFTCEDQQQPQSIEIKKQVIPKYWFFSASSSASWQLDVKYFHASWSHKSEQPSK